MAAVSTPVALIFPIAAAAAQVTPSEELVKVAVNWWVAPVFSDSADGATDTVMALGGGDVAALTVITALADLVASCVDAAVTVPCPTTTPVNNPLALIVPKVVGANVHATPAVEPTTVGVNCSVPPTFTLALGGVIVTLIGAGAAARVPMR